MKSRLSMLCGLLLPVCIWAESAIENSVGMRLLRIDGGRYIQGSDGGERSLAYDFPMHINAQYFGNAEGPAHPTWITNPFYLADKEVTLGQWKAFVNETGYTSKTKQCVGWLAEKEKDHHSDFERNATFSWQNPGFKQADTHPVTGVNREDVQAFLVWLSKKEGVRYRLPTEAEWELCCRAGTQSWFSFGEDPQGLIHQHANVANVELEKHRPKTTTLQWLLDIDQEPGDGEVFTAPVGSFQANPWGFYDLHGNVWEWCQDLWLDTAYNPYKRAGYQSATGQALNPVNLDQPQTNENDFRVIRGGAWCTGPVIARSANRSNWDANDAACYIGFRVARDAEGTSKTQAAYEANQKARKAVELVGGTFYSNRGLDLELRFDKEGFNERILAALSFIPDLTRINLSPRNRDFALSQQSIDLLSKLPALTQIEFGCNLDLETIDLRPLAQLKQLENLHFPRTASLSDKHLQMLSGLTSLRSFSCYGAGTMITDEGFAALAGNRQLESLRMHEHRAKGEALTRFVGCPLHTLELSAAERDDSQFTDATIKVLEQFPELTKLEITREIHLGPASIQSMSTLTQLEGLRLEGCRGLADNDFAPLAQLTQLRHLGLRDTAFSDEGIAAITSLPRLTSLHIGHPSISDQGLRELQQLYTLNQLNIDTMGATDEGIKHLGRINRLERLDIGGPNITGSGLGPIAQLPTLKDFKLRCPQLTDVAFDYLSQAKSIQKLRLVERGVKPPAALTNDGLAKMAKATWLKELWVPRNDTGITEDYINELKTLMPKTGVIPYTVSWK